MKCLILAAGYATRLYPLTENFPKPLLEVGGKTILDWLIDDIDGSSAVDGYIVVSNHKFAGHLERWAAERNASSERCGVRPVITVVDDGTSTNETRLGAVCDIKYAVDLLGIADDMLIIAGDNLLDFSLQAFIRYSVAKATGCVMRFYEPDESKLHRCGVLEVDADDLITGMEEKPASPRSHWVCPPFYFYRREDIERIGEAMADGCGTDAPGSYVAWLSSRTAVHAMEMPGRRYDIGNLESYRSVQETYKGINR